MLECYKVVKLYCECICPKNSERAWPYFLRTILTIFLGVFIFMIPGLISYLYCLPLSARDNYRVLGWAAYCNTLFNIFAAISTFYYSGKGYMWFRYRNRTRKSTSICFNDLAYNVLDVLFRE